MISYSFRIISIFIIIFFSIFLKVLFAQEDINNFAQEDINNIDSSPQNIVPDIPELETNTDTANSDKLSIVRVSELPTTNPSWIGNLSYDDGLSLIHI